MKTAEDFWNNACKNEKLKSTADIMIEFAKLHIKEALKKASEEVYVSNAVDCEIDRDSVLNAYPLRLIK